MRGMVDGLVNPQPLARNLPAAYQGSDALEQDEHTDALDEPATGHDGNFTERFLAGLDDVTAPIIATLDNVAAYLDPRLTPPDFLPWLASWVGLELNENWSEEQQRRLIGRVVFLYGWRGTRRGLEDLLSLFLGIGEDQIEIEDSGGAAWSATPNGHAPGTAEPSVTVRVRADEDAAIDDAALDRLVAAMTPAHVVHRAEVVRE